jgi:hypothetical protein
MKRHLVPSIVSDHHRTFAKDWGLHLKMLQIPTTTILIFPVVPLSRIGRVDNDTYTIMANMKADDDEYCASFDFPQEVKKHLFSTLPPDMASTLDEKLEIPPAMVTVQAQQHLRLLIEAHRHEKVFENKDEQYMPLRATKIELNLGVHL